MKITIVKEIQRRQYVLEHRAGGIMITLRWDEHVQRSSEPFPGNAAQAKRYCATMLDREADLGWSANEVGGTKVEYSDVVLVDSTGGRLSDAELQLVRDSGSKRRA